MENPFNVYVKTLQIDKTDCHYFDILSWLTEKDSSSLAKYATLPFSLRIILESLIRNCDGTEITIDHVNSIINWGGKKSTSGCYEEIPFKPARVLLQDFTGVPAVVDFAAMRDAVKKLGGDPQKINPLCPVDLVIDHSVQVDASKSLPQHSSETLNMTVKQKGGRYNSGFDQFSNRHCDNNVIIPGPGYDKQLLPNNVRILYENSPPIPSNTFYIFPHTPSLTPLYHSIPPLVPMVSPFYNTPFVPQIFNHPPLSIPQPILPLQITNSYVTQNVYQEQFVNVPKLENPPAILDYAQKNSHFNHSPYKHKVNNKADIKINEEPMQYTKIDKNKAISLCFGKEDKSCMKDINDFDISDASTHTCLICDAVPSSNIRRYLQCPFHNLTTDCAEALNKNQSIEFERNKERFEFLKWGATSFRNMRIIPPGGGIVHQVNLEYLARVVFLEPRLPNVPFPNMLYPDSVVGTDSHTTMINGLGVLGWGVGGIEAESVMLGQAITMEMPEVIGCHITGSLDPYATSTDLVLTITRILRQAGLVGKFVEFYGPGVEELSIADRATVSNMCPEYGATLAYFPVDKISLEYLLQTGRSAVQVEYIEKYLRAVQMFRDYNDPSQDPQYSEIIEIDLNQVTTCVSGPKRPQDKVSLKDIKSDFISCLTNPTGFKGFGLSKDELDREIEISEYALEMGDGENEGGACSTHNGDGKACDANGIMHTSSPLHVNPGRTLKLRHGSVVIAAITSCTNTSNPSVMLGAGLLAKKAVEAGLKVPLYVKTSLSPGSGVVTHYLRDSLTLPYLERLGFGIVGYGCMTCIGNSGPLPPALVKAIEGKDGATTLNGKGDRDTPLVVCAVLSGNRNFEGRVHPHTRANYLASPLLVVAYALAGRVDIDFETEPLGYKKNGTKLEPVYLREIWPVREEIKDVEKRFVLPRMFTQVYKSIEKGNDNWQNLQSPESAIYPWSNISTYIKSPPFFDSMTNEVPSLQMGKDLVTGARILLWLGDSVTTDHISPAGSIARNSPAAKYLIDKGLTPREFNSYGSRRGNDDVMVRGTFGNARLVNKLLTQPNLKSHSAGAHGKAPTNCTIHFGGVPGTISPPLSVFDACTAYKRDNVPVIILAGKEYGSGSSRDWAAKGPYLLGVKAVIAESFERIHRSNLVGMGILPLEFLKDQNAKTLQLMGDEIFDIGVDASDTDLAPKGNVKVRARNDTHTIDFEVLMRIDTQIEIEYFKNGGILNYMIRKML